MNEVLNNQDSLDLKFTEYYKLKMCSLSVKPTKAMLTFITFVCSHVSHRDSCVCVKP